MNTQNLLPAGATRKNKLPPSPYTPGLVARATDSAVNLFAMRPMSVSTHKATHKTWGGLGRIATDMSE
jgi:hypothetical protein